MAKKISEPISREAKIQKSCSAMSHHFNCKSTNCTVISCRKIKKLNHHKETCRRPSCGICRQYIALISYHSKTCNENICSIPHCSQFKNLRSSLSQ